jgi:Rap1a immunity proteins
MRAYIIAAGLALSVIGSAHGSVVDSGTDAQKSCQSLVDGGFQDSSAARAAGSCEGMLETAMVFSPNMSNDVRACPPAQGSTVESAKVLLRYLDRNPGRLSEAGITLAIEALRDAWPCEGDDAATTGGPARTVGPGPKPKKRVAKKPKTTAPAVAVPLRN